MQQDEDIYSFFEPDLPSVSVSLPRSKVTTDGVKFPTEKKPSMKVPAIKSAPMSSQYKAQRPVSNSEKKTNNHICSTQRKPAPEKVSWNVLDLKKENYFSCAVGRNRTNARYTLDSPDDVVSFLKELAGASSSLYL